MYEKWFNDFVMLVGFILGSSIGTGKLLRLYIGPYLAFISIIITSDEEPKLISM
jgi:hypothetical protein